MSHQNNLIVGETRTGKTNLVIQMLIRILVEGALVVFLGKETRAGARELAKFALQNSLRFIFDDVDDHERVFPLAILPRTGDRFEKEQNIEGLIECLMRRRGAANADQNPLIETVTEHWANLIYELDLPIDGRLFRRGLVDGNSESADFWNEIPGGAARERVVGATERLTSILKKPTVRARVTRDGNRFLEMIDDGFSYFLQGGDRITQAELRFIIGTRVNEIIRYKRSGGQRRIILVIEESESLGLTQQEAVAIQTLQKTGLSFCLICQEPNWEQK